MHRQKSDLHLHGHGLCVAPVNILMTSTTFSNPKLGWAAALAGVPLLLLLRKLLRRSRRLSVLPRSKERVLILGASSGIGRSIAEQYASKGARVCIVGRRANEVQEVEAVCSKLYEANTPSHLSRPVIAFVADFTRAEDMVRLRNELIAAWQGVDTVIVSAGASSLRPVLEIARGDFSDEYPSVEGVQRTANVATAALSANYIGPLTAAVTFIPLLEKSSVSPSILLISSLAALIPSPTRALYCSTKGASLLLYQSLAIEHPLVKFSHILPYTVEGNFRASAVDSGSVREADPHKHGLKIVDVARRSIEQVDLGERIVFMPAGGRQLHWLYWLWPSVIERFAAKKYNFSHPSH